MAPDDDDDSEDLYDDEFDFVDDDDDDNDDDDASDVDDGDDDDSELDPAADSALESTAEVADSELDNEPAPRAPAAKRSARGARSDDSEDRGRDSGSFGREPVGSEADDEPVDESAPPPPPANFRVHIYEHRQFKRTIDRPFTAEDAEAFASEFNRTSKSYGRFALAGKEDAKPRKMLDD